MKGHKELDKYFRELLIKERKLKGLTQVEVAKLLMKPQSYVSKYENGEKRLDFIETLNLCNTLEISAISLINKIKKFKPSN